MQRRGRARPVERASHRLAVDRDDALAGLGKPPHEAEKPAMESRWVEQPEHPAEGVVARDAMLQPQKLLQERAFRPAKKRHVRAVLPAAQHRTQRDHQNLVQQMPLGVAGSRIVEILENLINPRHGTAPQKLGALP
jgi:hypothetical protein